MGQVMIQATITISVKYAPDADMKEAIQDKAELEKELRRYFIASVANTEDIHIDHTIAEVQRTNIKES